jgi:GAF domain-containing protein
MTDDMLQELARVAAALGRAVEPPGAERLLSSLAETARRLFGARACSLALLTDEGSELLYTTAAGDGAEAVTGLRMPAARGIAGWVVQSGQPVAISDVRSDPRFAPDVAEATGYLPQAILAAPVVSEGDVRGVLSVLDRDASRPGAQDDLLLLQVFCDQAAIALETARSFRQVAAVLLEALGTAAAGGTTLSAQLTAASSAEHDDDLLQLAGLFARLGREDAAARRLALDVVTDVLDFVDRRAAPRPGG